MRCNKVLQNVRVSWVKNAAARASRGFVDNQCCETSGWLGGWKQDLEAAGGWRGRRDSSSLHTATSMSPNQSRISASTTQKTFDI